MAPKAKSRLSQMRKVLSVKKLMEKSQNPRTLSTQSGDAEGEEEARWRSFEIFGEERRRAGWPQPARFPTERERRRLTTSTDGWVSEPLPDPHGHECCSSSASDIESDCDSWNAATGIVEASSDCNGLGFRTPMPLSLTSRDVPDWRACAPIDSKSSSHDEVTAAKNKEFISGTSSVNLVFGPRRANQTRSLSSSRLEDFSSEVWEREKGIPQLRILNSLPEQLDFSGVSAYQRLRVLRAASHLDNEDDMKDSYSAWGAGLAAISSDDESDESDESDDEACHPRRTKTRSDFPQPSEYLSLMAYQRLRALCGALPLDEHNASAAGSAALLANDELSKWRRQEWFPQRTQAHSDFPPPEEYLKPAFLAKLMLEMHKTQHEDASTCNMLSSRVSYSIGTSS